MHTDNWPPLRFEPKEVRFMMRKAGTSTLVLAALFATGCATTPRIAHSQANIQTQPAMSVAPETPEQFLGKIYKRYRENGPGVSLADQKVSQRVYDPTLLSLMLKDVMANPKEAGLLDSDPICDCQDFSISNINIETGKQNGIHILASVSFKNLADTKRVNFDLIQNGNRWQIYDIANPSFKSLRTYIQTPQNFIDPSIKQLKPQPR